MTIFFAAALFGVSYFLSMYFAFCMGRIKREDKDDEDVQ